MNKSFHCFDMKSPLWACHIVKHQPWTGWYWFNCTVPFGYYYSVKLVRSDISGGSFLICLMIMLSNLEFVFPLAHGTMPVLGKCILNMIFIEANLYYLECAVLILLLYTRECVLSLPYHTKIIYHIWLTTVKQNKPTRIKYIWTWTTVGILFQPSIISALWSC